MGVSRVLAKVRSFYCDPAQFFEVTDRISEVMALTDRSHRRAEEYVQMVRKSITDRIRPREWQQVELNLRDGRAKTDTA